jgi:hypothetical protein
MAIKLSAGLKNYLLGDQSLKDALESGNSAPAGLYLFYFSGPVPATADAPLDMVADHTQLVKIAADATAIANGIVPLELAAAAASGFIGKSGSQTWKGLVAFDGVNNASPTQLATFFRLCAGGDNGRGAGGGTTYRVQGTIGTVPGFDLLMPNPTLSNSGTEERGLSLFQVGFLDA